MTEYLKSTFSKEGTFDEEAVKTVPQKRYRPELDKPPDFNEYKTALSKLNHGRAPGDDGNFAELYKALLLNEDTENCYSTFYLHSGNRVVTLVTIK